MKQATRRTLAVLGAWYMATSAMIAAIIFLGAAVTETMDIVAKAIISALQISPWYGVLILLIFAFFGIGVVAVVVGEVTEIRQKWHRRFQEFARRREKLKRQQTLDE